MTRRARFVNFLKHISSRVAIIIASVAQNNHRCTLIDIIEAQFAEVRERLAVIRGAVAVLLERQCNRVSRGCLSDGTEAAMLGMSGIVAR